MNYFNTLPLRLQLDQLGKCRFMDASEFSDGVTKLLGKKSRDRGMRRPRLKPGSQHAR